MENELKVGDRVRIKGDSTKTEHVIKKITEGYYWLSGTGAFIGGIWLEKIEPYDPKAAFLSKLKGLLEEYGAEIELLSYDLDSTQLGITSNEFEVEYPIGIQQITAKNIMDYDKK